MNLTKNQIVIIASLIVVVVAYFMFFRKKKVTTTQMAAPAESSWSPEYTSDAIALATARGGYAGTESGWAPDFTSKKNSMRNAQGGDFGMYGAGESGYDGLAAPAYGKMPTNWLY
jgi:hypothetical protein